MIIPVIKYLIIGANEDLNLFFEKAQETGFMEFITKGQKKITQQPLHIQNLFAAIKILRKLPRGEPYLGSSDLQLTIQTSERILELSHNLEKLVEEKRVIEAEILRVSPFGRFSLSDLIELENQSNRRIQFFCMKAGKHNNLAVLQEVIYITTEYDLDYFIAINQQLVSYPDMIEMKIETSLGELESRLNNVHNAINRFEKELKSFAGYIGLLQHNLVEELNAHRLSYAKNEVSYPLNNSLFSVEIWIPENKEKDLFKLIENLSIHAEKLLIEKNEVVPTCIDNNGLGLVGEDLMKIYDIPNPHDKDPSHWVLWSFALFFSIIIGDGGYGFIFLLLAFFLKKRFPTLQGSKKRLLKLVFILSTSCIVWGVLTSSYFGIKIIPGGFVSQISPLYQLADQKAMYHLMQKDDVYKSWIAKHPNLNTAQTGTDFLKGAVTQRKNTQLFPMQEEFTGNILLELTLMLGIVHLSGAFIRYLRKNIAGLGWIMFMIGGYLYFPSFLNATSIVNFTNLIPKHLASAIGFELIWGGLGFAMIAAFIQRGWKGISEITHAVQVFSDVLSYLRLYALSLAGAIMATTFNQEGSALGFVVGAFAVIVGHCINISLGLMGGVIHGLRLNFLEWYHYCFDGGGRLFKPLHKIKRSD